MKIPERKCKWKIKTYKKKKNNHHKTQQKLLKFLYKKKKKNIENFSNSKRANEKWLENPYSFSDPIWN